MAVIITFTLGFLSILSLSKAAEPNCEEIVKPLVLDNSYTGILKRWIFVEGVANNSLFINILRTVNSSWIEFTPTHSADTYSLSQGNMLNGKCEFQNTNATLKDDMLYATEKEVTSVGVFMPTCVNCLTISFESQVNNITISSLYLFTRKQRPSESEMELYWKQVECLGISKEPQFSYDFVTEFCQKDQSRPSEKVKPEPKNDE